MATINDAAVAGNIAGVGQVAGNNGLHITQKPIPYGSLGHYRVTHRTVLVNAQAANSRLFEARNSGTNLIVLTGLLVKWFQTAAHTAIIEDSIDCFKCTAFTAVDNTNVVTPVASVAKTNGMSAAPGNLQIRGVTIAGASAGMTGGTLTKDGGAFAQSPKWLTALFADPQRVEPTILDALPNVPNAHPFVFAQNEGFIIENRVLLGAAAGSSVYIDLSYAEVTAF
jgi:hypothetical protein